MKTSARNAREASLRSAEVRSSAAAIRRHLGELDTIEALGVAARILREEPQSVGIIKIYQYLMAIRGIGEPKTDEILKGLFIWPLRRIETLTCDELQDIAFALEKLIPNKARNRARYARELQSNSRRDQ